MNTGVLIWVMSFAENCALQNNGTVFINIFMKV
jgi:hypothetical protein